MSGYIEYVVSVVINGRMRPIRSYGEAAFAARFAPPDEPYQVQWIWRDRDKATVLHTYQYQAGQQADRLGLAS